MPNYCVTLNLKLTQFAVQQTAVNVRSHSTFTTQLNTGMRTRSVQEQRTLSVTVLSVTCGCMNYGSVATVGLVLTTGRSDFSSQHLPQRSSERLIASGIDERVESRVDETDHHKYVEQIRVHCCDLPTKKQQKTNYYY